MKAKSSKMMILIFFATFLFISSNAFGQEDVNKLPQIISIDTVPPKVHNWVRLPRGKGQLIINVEAINTKNGIRSI